MVGIEEAAHAVRARLETGLTREQLLALAVEELRRSPALLQMALDVELRPLFRALIRNIPLVHYTGEPGFCDTLTNIKHRVGVAGYKGQYDRLREFLNELVRAGVLGRTRGPRACSVYHHPDTDPSPVAAAGVFADVCDRVFVPQPGGPFRWRGRDCAARKCPACGADLRGAEWAEVNVLEVRCTAGHRVHLDFGAKRVVFKNAGFSRGPYNATQVQPPVR